MKKCLFAITALALIFACTPEENNTDEPDGGGKGNLTSSVTVEAKNVSTISAVLAGKANLGSTVASDLKIGFQYSKSAGILPSNSTTIEATDADANYNYTMPITGLDPATKYYFRSFVCQNGQETYGKTKEFMTKNVVSLLETRDASGVEAAKATLNAKLDLSDVLYRSLAYGFLWGTSESALNTDYKCKEVSGNAISATLTNLSHKTQYWYKAYVKLDSQTFYGEVKTFTTNVVPVESVSLNKTEHTFNIISNTLTLTATVFPADATNKSVEWSSDKEDVATVDANGRVTARGNGKATITATTKDQGKTAACVITVAQWVTSISLNRASITLNKGQEQTLIPTVNPANAVDKSLNWTSSNNFVARVNAKGKVTAVSKGTATIKTEAKDGSGVFASCVVSVTEPYTAVAGEAVDLGLSVKWSSINLGATSSSDYGDYFAWGETSPKDNYSWETYKWCNGSSHTLTKYNYLSSFGTVDNKSEFKDYGYEDDAARQALGGKWRVPTIEEWRELRRKCTWTWTTQKGVKGYKVSATNGNSIFLPAARFMRGSSLYNVGSQGYYMSSLRYGSNYPSNVWYNYFDDDEAGVEYFLGRCVGLSVRPVTE